MRIVKKVDKVTYECDGCGYVLTEGSRYITLYMYIRADREEEEFHFHPITFEVRSDCLRYWILNPRIIKETLEVRGYSPADIEMALSRLSYREEKV